MATKRQASNADRPLPPPKRRTQTTVKEPEAGSTDLGQGAFVDFQPHLFPAAEAAALLQQLEEEAAVERATSTTFNSCLMNYYRSGSDHMGWHSDNEPLYSNEPCIASVSFGVPREFILRSNAQPADKYRFRLGTGSLLIMRGTVQQHWMHCVPKRKGLEGARTFSSQCLLSMLDESGGLPGVKGRCSAVDLLVCPLGSSCKSLRAVNYTRLLKYADLDGLLALAQKVQLHAMQRTTSMALEEPRAEPVNKAMLALQRAAEAAARHLAGDEGGSPRSPSSPRPAGSLAEQTAGACSLSISQQLPASQGQAVRS
ncbi:hypothetical protein N2152v2_000495 [Parachlorella kessleri]